jgi:cellulose biosynthesis protein BcsQ
MAKVISLFNHKSGVSKTTTTFHLGWMLTKLGLKVLIVDTDPQCNLTGLVLGINDYGALFKFYERRGNYDIYNSLADAFGFDSELKDASKEGISKPTETNNRNMSLIAGHVDFAKFDLQIATALTSSMSLPLLRPLLGSINSLIRKTADNNSFDVVLIDMSPNISATNMCIFMASDYFIVPTSPDFFCYQSIESLSNVFPDWCKRLQDFKDGKTLPNNNPKLLGVISQNFRTYSSSKENDDTSGDTPKDMAKEFKEWSNKIKNITNGMLVPALQENNMIVSEETFRKYVSYDTPYNLANIKNFNSLIPTSQRLAKPIFEIKKEDTKWGGGVWERERKGEMIGAKHDIKKAETIYSLLANSVAGMIGFDTKIA